MKWRPIEDVPAEAASWIGQGLLRDQRDSIEVVFQTVKDERPLSESRIKEWHALLTRYQDTAPGRDRQGRRIEVAFLKGAYKRRPNNPRRVDGTIHEYCPPEHTASEMERLIAMHHGHDRDGGLPAPVEAAWLHHRFVQIHPFEDGNGRTARLLMSYVFAKRAEPTPVITTLEKPGYFDALQEADRGSLRTFVQMLETKAVEGLRYATRSIENMLEGRHRYFHMNGDLSTRSAENGWTRHRGTNGRESVIDAAGTSAGTQADGHDAREERS